MGDLGRADVGDLEAGSTPWDQPLRIWSQGTESIPGQG